MIFRFVTAAIIGASALPAQADIVVHLKESAEVRSRQVKLAEVVSFEAGAKSAIAQALGNTLVVTVMHVNQPFRIESGQIMRLIARQQPALRDQFRLAGASAVTIILPGERVPAERIAAAAKSFLQEELHRSRVNFVIRDMHIRSDSALVPNGELQLKARLASPLQPARRINVVVDLFVDNRRVDSVTVSAEVDMFVQIYRATRPLASGDVLQAGDYELIERPFDELTRGASLLDTTTELTARRVRRNIAAHVVLYRHDVEAVPHVVRNQKILAEVKSNGILIEKMVVAQSDGQLGQTIKVSDARSAVFYPAKVVAHGRVEVK